MKSLLGATCIALSFSAFGATAPEHAHVNLNAPTMKSMKSTIDFQKMDKGIKVVAEVSGIKPGSVHGFHIHEKGECKGPDFKSAGGHLNPYKHTHNSPAAMTKHLGDMGNLIANENGVAKTEVIIPEEEGLKLESIIGKAVILHAKPDDLNSQPSGNAGDRIACGVIKI